MVLVCSLIGIMQKYFKFVPFVAKMVPYTRQVGTWALASALAPSGKESPRKNENPVFYLIKKYYSQPELSHFKDRVYSETRLQPPILVNFDVNHDTYTHTRVTENKQNEGSYNSRTIIDRAISDPKFCRQSFGKCIRLCEKSFQ